VAVLGGIKLETKLPLVRRFLKEADRVVIGGGVANSILYAKGLETGKSTVERFQDKAILKSKKLFLPHDLIVAKSLSTHIARVAAVNEVHTDEYIVDIGPESLRKFCALLKNTKTVVWNGSLGFTPYFSVGTDKFAKSLAHARAFKIIGGGDTIAALKLAHVPLRSFSHVSTGGGAMLEFLAGKKLPGIEALKR
jgi:phosphoglycerate kinase